MLRDPPADATAFVAEFFRRNAFAELTCAEDGVPRDAINVAALAAQRANDNPIGVADVRHAARDWYLRDKHTAISANPGAAGRAAPRPCRPPAASHLPGATSPGRRSTSIGCCRSHVRNGTTAGPAGGPAVVWLREISYSSS
jgi:hypothetical protein